MDATAYATMYAAAPATPGKGATAADAARADGRRLDLFAFFTANLQTGFGPFVSAYLTQRLWPQADIGLALTVGGLVALFGQIPAGAMIDRVRSMRAAAGLSVAAIGLCALLLAGWPGFVAVTVAMAAHSAASCVLTPATAALGLGIVSREGAGERLGRNARYSSMGGAIAAAGMGACGYYLSNAAVFYLAAALAVPALMALARVPDVPGGGRGSVRARSGLGLGEVRALVADRPLMAFAACLGLFHLANAAMLPMAGSVLTLRAGASAPLLVAACIVVPQVVVVFAAPWAGRAAQRYGRKPLLLLGFAALVARGILFARVGAPEAFVAVQLLDGVTASVIGVLTPLVVDDLTRGAGRFNLAFGAINTAVGLGASFSTTLGGYLADGSGTRVAFLGMAAAAGVGMAFVALALPETRPETRPGPSAS